MDGLEFVEKSVKIHRNKYDYSLVNYINNYIKIKIICPVHDIFEQIPYSHLNGVGCSKCRNRKTEGKYISEVKLVHNNYYDYSLVEYVNTVSKIKIVCPVHGVFEQIADHHLRGSKCPKCVRCKKHTKEEFIKLSNSKHFYSNYNYSLVNYKNNRTKVKIICPIHGVFEQIPKHHLNGVGCPKCKNKSKGEKMIKKILKDNNIIFKTQKTFDGCFYKKKLQFDFYLPEYNLCIEYDGIQHFKSIEWFGGVDGFLKTKLRDEIKNNFCERKQISLLRIPYNEDVTKVLYNYFNG